MRLILDADALIKLNRAGILRALFEAYECTVPMAVYQEVVTQGRSRKYPDAVEIENAIAELGQVETSNPSDSPTRGLGPGELEVLELAHTTIDPVIVSDDRRFLAIVGIEGFDFIKPSLAPVLLAESATLTRDAVMHALAKMQGSIRRTDYADAVAQMDSIIGERHDKE